MEFTTNYELLSEVFLVASAKGRVYMIALKPGRTTLRS